MAKHLLFDYTFDPSINTVTLPGNLHSRRLLIITNTTDNIIIYNFADNTKTGTVTYDATTNSTAILLQHDCSAMSASDSLQIFYEKDEVHFEPSETFVDAVSKFRVSNPENLIDTDFEYGPQASKWETIQTINNIPSFFSSTSDTTIPFISKVESIQGNELITVTTSFDHNLTSGVPITVTGLSSITAEGTYIIQAVPTTTTFTYKARAGQPESRELQGTYTSIIPGKFFQGSQISLDRAAGIVSDQYTKRVTVEAITTILFTSTVDINDWAIGSTITGAGGGNGKLVGVLDKTITLIDVTGAFNADESVTATGSSTSYTIESAGNNPINTSAGNKYFVDGELHPGISFSRKAIYIFDVSDASVTGHPLRFSTTADGTHGGGSAYTTYVYEQGTAGQAGAYVRIYVTNASPDTLYYYCGNHANMAGNAGSTIAQHTVTDVDYSPTVGTLKMTIGAHSLTVGSHIKVAPQSIKLTCDYHNDGNTTIKSYPRASGAATATGADYIFNKAVRLEAVDATSITINVNGGQGAVTDTSPHVYAGGTATNAVTSGVGNGVCTIDAVTTSKVYLTTVSEHGFQDNTNFYFVNTVSPKILEVADPTAIAPDGKTYVDIDATETVAPDIDEGKTVPYNWECTYVLRFSEEDVDYSANTINLPAHRLQNHYAMLYYPNPGNRPLGGLKRMQVYYVQRIDDDTIKLYESQRINSPSGGINLSDAYPAGSHPYDGTWTYGQHNLGLVYNIYREYKWFNNWYTYYYTYYWNWRGTYSGHDFASINNTYGLGNQGWDRTVFFGCQRDGYGGRTYFFHNRYYESRGAHWRTYGYNHEQIPFGSSSRYNGNYGFLTYNENRYLNDINWNETGNGYAVQGYNSQIQGTFYWRDSINTQRMTHDWLRIQGNNWFFWFHHEGWGINLDRYFGSINEDGQTNMYIALVRRNTSTNDSFYAENHGFEQNTQVTLSVTNGGEIRYFYDVYGNNSSYTSGTFYIDRIDNNRFRIKTSTGASPLKLKYATGTIALTGIRTNSTRYSVYIAQNLFSNNEILKYTTQGTDIGGLTNGNSYYVKVVNGDRFQLRNSVNGSEVTLSSRGTGIQTFENTTAEFGVVDGSYTTTKAISDTELEVTIPFKIPPSVKQFDASSTVNTTDDHININNHYYSTGTRVIYDNTGNSDVGGLTHNTDYYVIAIDNNYFKLAETQALAIAGTAIDLTSTSSGFHQLVSANLSGEVTGTGTVDVQGGTRTVKGSGAAFQRFFKIGDDMKIVNTSGGTPGVIETRTITAITDDDNLIVDSNWTFTQTGTNYLIPSYIYVRPDGFFLHRPFDGGMEIGTSKSPNSRISRQTRKYFRYQSGKGIQTSLAINFIPQIPILTLSYSSAGTALTDTGVTGTLDSRTLTVTTTTGLVADQILVGPGIPSLTRIDTIVDGTTLELSKALTADITAGTAVEFRKRHTARAVTVKPHQLSNDLKVKIINTDTVEYNIESNIHRVVDDFTFDYLLEVEPPSDKGAGFPTVNVLGWNDCDIRCGMFDDQNGFFFEYDGTTLNCCRRSSVQQIPGKIAVTKASHIVTGIDTMFTSQLINGDMIVIRGMSYKVVKVTSDTQITIQPSYRGITNSDVIMTKTVDTKVGQTDWNIDTGDGNGVSGYILDLSKIQMAYMDYSWYGAGKIRFGFKDQNGHVKYFHQFKHNNLLTESYFRSGNLPARYEIENGNNPTYVGTLFHWGTSVIMDGMFQNDEAYLFTASGQQLKFTNSSAQSAASNNNSSIVEEWRNWWSRYYYIRIPFPSSDQGLLSINTNIYHPTTANTYFLTGRPIHRNSFVSGSTYYVYIQYFEGTTSYFPRNYYTQINNTLGNPAVSNSTTFSVGAPSGNENLIPTDIPLISIRLAPSVDSSITGALGEREIINRMQLALDSVGILTTHETEISLVLNPSLSTDTFQNVENPSLCQLVRHAKDDSVSGGNVILSFRATGASSGEAGATNFDLSRISALGNSILGGDGIYPNGPDLLTVVGNVVDSSGVSLSTPYSISARITWQESQA